MADLTHDQGARKWAVDKAWLASATLVLLVALFDWPQVAPMLAFAAPRLRWHPALHRFRCPRPSPS